MYKDTSCAARTPPGAPSGGPKTISHYPSVINHGWIGATARRTNPSEIRFALKWLNKVVQFDDFWDVARSRKAPQTAAERTVELACCARICTGEAKTQEGKYLRLLELQRQPPTVS
jgi:hypothetical protein